MSNYLGIFNSIVQLTYIGFAKKKKKLTYIGFKVECTKQKVLKEAEPATFSKRVSIYK